MELINNKDLQSKIFTIRGIQVMLDRDLAELFNVEVKRLNEQVKRNIERFPENFRFSLIDHEKNELVAICDRFKSLKYSSNNSFAFTEQGVAMLHEKGIFENEYIKFMELNGFDDLTLDDD
jgi:hypothetical protein